MITCDVKLRAEGLRFGIVAARFNEPLVAYLISGAERALLAHGASAESISLFRVPGSFEVPVVCKELLESGKYDALVALGVLIRGETPHFDLICKEVSGAIMTLSLEFKTAIGFGVVMTENLQQAQERAGIKMGNKGEEAAMAALETALVLRGCVST